MGLSLVGNEWICTLKRRVFWSFCRTDMGKRNFVVVELLLQQECCLCKKLEGLLRLYRSFEYFYW